MLRIYAASSMTGRTGEELVAQSKHIAELALKYKVYIHDPITSEGTKSSKTPLNNGGKKLEGYWKRDKEMIADAHVLVDVTGPRKSAGVEHEVGLARYFMYKPVIRVWPGLGYSIARLEDDIVVETVEEAIQLAVRNWGTWQKRLSWRTNLYRRCWKGMVINFFREWKNCLI